ncbi:esterase-like activity of phytase family protein [Silicimonas sp. MF1-12-2]|uniref:esterase-like activity of phytase family protein n=1 Tax=Silicimonas sp. MF1-12-2 TaxID=3384793 RepID=UPI0039B5A0F3
MRASLVALILAAGAQQVFAEELVPIGRYDWDTDLIVGLSGLEVSEDGSRFHAVGDRGFWMTGRFERDGEVIVDIELDRLEALYGQNGYPVSARRVGDWSDAEGLAIAPDGTAWVSFERWARVSRYEGGLHAVPQWIKDHPTFYDLADNWELEAVALSPDGILYAFSEKPLNAGFPIYRLDGDTWTIDGYLPENDLFAIVGADFDENGDLYILERKLVVGLWWQNRIRRVRLDGSEDRVLWTGERGEYLNLEGIAVWRDNSGLRLTLVSDNNGEENEPAQFVEFRLTE